jgi:hypothetical protein
MENPKVGKPTQTLFLRLSTIIKQSNSTINSIINLKKAQLLMVKVNLADFPQSNLKKINLTKKFIRTRLQAHRLRKKLAYSTKQAIARSSMILNQFKDEKLLLKRNMMIMALFLNTIKGPSSL